MRIDLNALVIFAQAAEEKSFSACAHSVRIPLSTVSRRIADLETALGVRLFERSTRALRLTEAGAEILDHARRCRDIRAAVADIAAHKRRSVEGVLRLCAPSWLIDSLVVPLVIAFQGLRPGARFTVDITGGEVDLIADGVDLAFRPRSQQESSHVALTILRYRHVLVASPRYVAARPTITRPADVEGHRFLACSMNHGDHRWTFREVASGAEEAVTFSPGVAINDPVGLVPPLTSAAGIGILPTPFRPDLLRDGHLVEVRPAWRLRTEELTLVHLGSRHMPSLVRAFKDFAAAEASTLIPSLDA